QNLRAVLASGGGAKNVRAGRAGGRRRGHPPKKSTHPPSPPRPPPAKGRPPPPASSKEATSGTPTAALTPEALVNQPMALPRPVGGTTSAIAARILGPTIAAPTPVRRRHTSKVP